MLCTFSHISISCINITNETAECYTDGISLFIYITEPRGKPICDKLFSFFEKNFAIPGFCQISFVAPFIPAACQYRNPIPVPVLTSTISYRSVPVTVVVVNDTLNVVNDIACCFSPGFQTVCSNKRLFSLFILLSLFASYCQKEYCCDQACCGYDCVPGDIGGVAGPGFPVFFRIPGVRYSEGVIF